MAKAAKGLGRKPIDIAAQARYGNQDSIWKTLRAHKKQAFTIGDLISWLLKDGVDNVNDWTVESYLARLVAGKYLKMVKPAPISGKYGEAVYQLVKDCGHEAPRLRKDGSAVTQGLGNEQMWRTMKVLKAFSPGELAIAASTATVSVKLSTAKSYAAALYRAGYLIVVNKSKPGTQAVYRLLNSKNTGPKPPQIQRTKRVFDPNLNAVIWSEDDDISHG
jgi:hypothetical protein